MKKMVAGISAFFMAFLFLIPQVRAAKALVPGGQVIALELGTHQVQVAELDPKSPAAAAGLKAGDQINKVDNTTVRSVEDIRQALVESNGTVALEISRKGKHMTVKLQPGITPDGPRLGVYLQQSITGVGTVTWYDPDTGAFGALGHGVSTSAGEQVQMTAGRAFPARVDSVRKGKIGEPGQLIGAMAGKDPLGILRINSPQGVFGKTAQKFSGKALPTAAGSQVKAGPATILSTVRGTSVQEYSVEILKVYPDSAPTGRNMLIKVTDPSLLEATGGIVQGMSGSPIIQDGKLVGAVTHVLVNDPTTGYGIFIENMLDAAA